MKHNLTIVLLSVIATLLAVVVVQNMNRPPQLIGQLGGGGGGGSVGPIGVATGSIKGEGEAAAFWLYDPESERLLVYFLGQRNKLELRAVRKIDLDKQVLDFGMRPGKPPGYTDMDEVLGRKKKKR